MGRGKTQGVIKCVGFWHILPSMMVNPPRGVTETLKEGAVPGTSFTSNESDAEFYFE